MAEVILPELGEGITKATVSFWHVKVGDHVEQGVDVVECVTDKATFNVPAENRGTLTKMLVKEGQEVKIGEALAIIQ